MSTAEPILPPISREAHARLVAEAVAAERERIAKWLDTQWYFDSPEIGPHLARSIRKGLDRGHR